MRQWSKVVTATATAALVALSPGVAVAGNGHGDARPGAAGIGDPYYPKDGNGGYDVTHYDLDLRYAPATDRLSGVATIKARATQDLSRFDLDFVGLRIDSISVNHKQARWNREGQELVIQPARPLRDRKKFTVRIEYAGVPQTIQDPLIGPSGFIHTDDGAIVAGQPHAAATWFPANDHPRDAASFRLDITVPEGLEAISNGVLAHRRTKHGWTTWSWRADEPMATYLTTLAIGQFQVQDYRADGLRFWDALDPDLFEEPNGNPDGSTYGEVAAGALEHQPEIIRFLESFAGPYPFEAAGGIVDDYPELFFALETQTRPIYSKLFFYDPVFGDDVVVHELAHQWFGDDVRLDGWQHIWLNEGFATYMEFLWFEHEGLATAQQIFEDLTSIPADDSFWDVKTGDPGPADLFDYEAVYLRGALTLHALRLEVGDAAFFRIVERWASTQSGSTVTTAEFVRLAERVSGQQLDDFFRAWLFTAAKPAGLPQAPGAKASAAAASGGAEPVLARLTAERPRR